jgi:hypothetical protein
MTNEQAPMTKLARPRPHWSLGLGHWGFVDLLDRHPNVRHPPLDHVRHATGAGTHALERRPPVDPRLDDPQAALPRALFSTFSINRAPRCGWYFKIASASSTRLPRIIVAIGRTLRAEI